MVIAPSSSSSSSSPSSPPLFSSPPAKGRGLQPTIAKTISTISVIVTVLVPPLTARPVP
jgi:hypothetical protein